MLRKVRGLTRQLPRAFRFEVKTPVGRSVNFRGIQRVNKRSKAETWAGTFLALSHFRPMLAEHETETERNVRVERELIALMERHGVTHLSKLPTGRAKRASERIGREAPDVYIQLRFANQPTHNDNEES